MDWAAGADWPRPGRLFAVLYTVLAGTWVIVANAGSAPDGGSGLTGTRWPFTNVQGSGGVQETGVRHGPTELA